MPKRNEKNKAEVVQEPKQMSIQSRMGCSPETGGSQGLKPGGRKQLLKMIPRVS